MMLSLLALVGVYFTEVPNKLASYFSLASWLLLGAIGYRFLHFARFVVTMFFVINTTLYIYSIYVNGINPLAFAPIASLIALTLLPRIPAYFFASIYAFAPLLLLWWHPAQVDSLFWRIFIVGLVLTVMFDFFLRMFRLTNEKLSKSMKETHQANLVKQNFLANISHEIRTPLNAVFGSLQVIKSSPTDAATVEKFADLGMEHFGYINQLIENFLDLNRVSEGRLKLNETANDLGEIIQEAVGESGNKAEQKGLKLECHLEGLDCYARRLFDKARVQQIVFNLVSNAIKFTDIGSVTISAYSVDNDEVFIRVTDTGIGIPEDKRDHIFMLFEQASPSRLTPNRGSGLGLPIVKILVSMMNGSIEMTSIVGKGSTFLVKLTLPKVSENSGV